MLDILRFHCVVRREDMLVGAPFISAPLVILAAGAHNNTVATTTLLSCAGIADLETTVPATSPLRHSLRRPRASCADLE